MISWDIERKQRKPLSSRTRVTFTSSRALTMAACNPPGHWRGSAQPRRVMASPPTITGPDITRRSPLTSQSRGRVRCCGNTLTAQVEDINPKEILKTTVLIFRWMETWPCLQIPYPAQTKPGSHPCQALGGGGAPVWHWRCVWQCHHQWVSQGRQAWRVLHESGKHYMVSSQLWVGMSRHFFSL